MINQQLLNPKSIVVIGGSNNEQKPGGAIVRNLKQGGFKGDLYVLNPKEDVVQGIQAHHDMKDLPNADLAILVVAAKYCPEYVDYLTEHKGVRAFIMVRRPTRVPSWSSTSWTPARSTVPRSSAPTASAC